MERDSSSSAKPLVPPSEFSDVVMRSGGRVESRFDDVVVSPANQSADVREVALGQGELFCCSGDGKLFRCFDADVGWQLEESLDGVTSVFALASGQIAAVSDSRIFVRGEGGEFSAAQELTDWIKTGQRPFRISSRVKWLVFIAAAVAAAAFFGMRTWEQAKEQRVVLRDCVGQDLSLIHI